MLEKRRNVRCYQEFILTDTEEIVARVTWAAAEEVEEEVVVPVEPEEVEVIAKGKEEVEPEEE